MNFKRILAFLLVLCIVLPCIGTVNATDATDLSVLISQLPEISDPLGTEYYFYNQLTDIEKAFYWQITKATWDSPTIAVSCIDGYSFDELASMAQRALTALIADSPEYHMLWNRYCEAALSENGFSFTLVRMAISSEYRIDKAESRAQQLVEMVGTEGDRYSIVRDLLDLMSEEMNFGTIFAGNTTYVSGSSDCAIGCLVYGVAVCAGFSDTVKILCDKLQVPCIIVGNAGHAWNYIQMEDGLWYAVDASIDLPFSFFEQPANLIGFNSPQYTENSNYHLSELYLANMGDFVFPELSETEYVYSGTYQASYHEAEGFVEPEPRFVYSVNEDGTTCTITAYEGVQAGDLVIPDSIDGYAVTAIGDGAFYMCTGFTGDLIIADTVTTIGLGSFESCTGFTGTLQLPENLKKIGQRAFFSDYNFSGELLLPDGMETIGDFAFYGAGFEGELLLPDGLEWTNWAISGTKIESLAVHESNENYATVDGILYSKDLTTLIVCPTYKSGELAIPNGVEEIADGAFLYCSYLTGQLILPDSLKKIGSSAFGGCSGLSGDLIIPDSVTEIAGGAFTNCGGFNGSLKLPDGITRIEDFTFVNCPFTGNLYIPETVTYIGNNVFWGVKGSLSLPDSVKYIGTWAFAACTFSNTVDLSNSSVIIEKDAFYGSVFEKLVCNCDAEINYDRIGDMCDYELIANYQCSNCGGRYEEQQLGAGHTYDSVVTPPTCTEQGYTTHTCACGDSYVDSHTDALGHSYSDDVCTRCGATLQSLALRYDDHYDMTGREVEILDAGIPTSYQVGYGVAAGTLDEAVIILDGNTLVATGIGTAMVRIDGTLYRVEVTAAPISLLLLAGQSNMQGSEGNADQSIVCPDGMVYATYGDRYTMTVDNATNYAPSALTGAGSAVNVNGNTTNLADWPVYLLNEAGAGKAGPDSGFAYEWVKQTGEKVWIVNAAHGGSSITTWQDGGANYEEAVLLFSACQETLRQEIAAGHYTLSHMGYFWCQGCTDYGQTAQWYVEKYLAMHENFRTELAFSEDVTFEFGGIIPVRAGHERYTSYRQGAYTDTTSALYHESFKDLRFTGPRVAQYWMINNPELRDIWGVCNIGENWVTMPDGTDGVAEYFRAHYENGTVDYTTQVPQKTAWYTPTTPAAVHDSIHYNQIGYNEVGREAARNALIQLGEIEAPAVETSVKFLAWDGYTEANEVTASTTGNSGTLVVPVVYPIWNSKEVTYEHSEGLSWNYYDLLAENAQTEGTLTVTGGEGSSVAVGKADPNLHFADHLSRLPEAVCCGLNLWNILEHDKYFYSGGTQWGIHSSGSVYSVTIPVAPGDRIFATSFGKAGENGHASANGIRVTFFSAYGVAKTLTAGETYAEFTANGGYLIAPEGTVAVNIPMWSNEDSNELYILSEEHTYRGGVCAICGAGILDSGYIHAVPENAGVQNAIDRARTLTDVEWTPLKNIPGVLYVDGQYIYQEFVAGATYTGIPYSGVIDTDTYVGLNVSLDSFLTALENEDSVLYTQNLFTESYPKKATYFGTVCSKFMQYVLDIPGSYNTANVPNIPGMNTIAMPGQYTADQIKLGDVIVDTSYHTAVCTGILYDANGNVAYIEISEAISPTCRRGWWSVEEFLAEFADYRLCRYADIAEVPPASEGTANRGYALMPEYGDKYNYRVSSARGTVNILERGYSKAVILRNGVIVDEIVVDDATETISFDRSVPGYIEIYLEKADGTRSGSVYACVVESSVTVTDSSEFSSGKLTVRFNGSSGTPLYVQVGSAHAIFCSVEGQQGTVELSFRFSAVSTQQVRVAYQNEYGIYLSEWSSFTTVPNTSEDPLLSQGQYWDGYTLTPNSHTPVVQENKTGYWTYTMVPVKENTTYYSEGSNRMWFLDSDGNPISTYNAYKDSEVPFQFTTPEGTAYVSLSYSPELVEKGVETLTEVVPAHTHSYTSVVTAPTCTEQGYTTHVCTGCGDSYVDSYVEATGHSYGEWTVVTEATCTENGQERRDCGDCDHYETRVIDAKGHSYTSVVTPPTCTEQGYTTHTCPCGDSYVDSYVNATGHSYGNWTVVVEATCTEDGQERRDCGDCDHYETRVVDAKGHDYTSVVTPPTCTEQGYTTHTCACGDSYVDTYVDAKGHSYGDWTVVTEATCTEDGQERRDCGNCDHYETRVIDAKGHDYTSIVIPPTCTEQGYTTHTCTECGDSYVDSYVNATGHSYGNWTVVTEATCTKNGQERRDCGNCDHCETRVIDAKGHNYTSVVTPPTCTERGYTTHTCTGCGDSYVDSYVEARGHSYGEWTVVTEATCTEDGQERRDCGNCDHYETRVIDAKGHNYTSVVTPPNCTERGYTTYTCTICGDSYVDNYTDALGHSYKSVVTLPTCTEGGYITHTCSGCGESYVVPYYENGIGHSMGDWYTFTEATCTANGVERRDCANCDHCETRETDMIPHTFESVLTAPTYEADGYTTYTCTVCGYSYEDDFVPALVHHEVLDGEDTQWSPESGAPVSVRVDAEIENFVNVLLNGEVLDEECYTITEGSTIVTLKPEYLATLPAGEHTLELIFTDGGAEVTFEILGPAVTLGDVNEDGEIDILDANLVVAWYNEIRELEDDQLQAADVNGDGEVDIMDANMIVAYYNEVIDTFPAQH